MGEFPLHDPEQIFSESESDKKEHYVPESTELTAEQKDDRLKFAQSLKNMFVRKPDGSIDKQKTLAERENFIKIHSLRDTAKYAKTLKIGKDEQGLPILTIK